MPEQPTWMQKLQNYVQTGSGSVGPATPGYLSTPEESMQPQAAAQRPGSSSGNTFFSSDAPTNPVAPTMTASPWKRLVPIAVAAGTYMLVEQDLGEAPAAVAAVAAGAATAVAMGPPSPPEDPSVGLNRRAQEIDADPLLPSESPIPTGFDAGYATAVDPAVQAARAQELANLYAAEEAQAQAKREFDQAYQERTLATRARVQTQQAPAEQAQYPVAKVAASSPNIKIDPTFLHGLRGVNMNFGACVLTTDANGNQTSQCGTSTGALQPILVQGPSLTAAPPATPAAPTQDATSATSYVPSLASLVPTATVAQVQQAITNALPSASTVVSDAATAVQDVTNAENQSTQFLAQTAQAPSGVVQNFQNMSTLGKLVTLYAAYRVVRWIL